MRGMSPVSDKHSTTEVVAALRRKLHEYMESAAEAFEETPQHTRSVVAYARYLVHIRKKLTQAVRTVQDAPSDVHERLLRQAEIAYLTNPERFANVKGRLELMKAWGTLLVEASEKLAADRERGQSYAKGDDGWNDQSPIAIASRKTLGHPRTQ
jgi:hypothetical protein